MKRWAKKSIYVFNVMLGFLVIFFVGVANSITRGLDISAINDVINYVSILEPSGFGSEIDLMFFMVIIQNYSHLAVTISIIWIILFLYMFKLSN